MSKSLSRVPTTTTTLVGPPFGKNQTRLVFDKPRWSLTANGLTRLLFAAERDVERARACADDQRARRPDIASCTVHRTLTSEIRYPDAARVR